MSPLLSLVGLLLPVAMLPGLMSAGTVPRWTVLAFLVPLMLYWVDWRRVPHKVLLVSILAYAAASLYWIEVVPDGQLELFRLTLLLAVFCVGSVCVSIERCLTLMAVGVAMTLPLVILQTLGFSGIPQTAPPAGLFLNKNVLAESAALLLIAMLYLRWWVLSLVLFLIVVLAKEKAAYVGLVAAAIVYVFPRYRIAAYLLIAASAVGVGLLISTPSALDRLDIWQDTVNGVTAFGQGVGSFYSMFPYAATHSNVIVIRPEHAHNEYLHFLFELGAGSLLISALAYYALRGMLELERLLLVFVMAVAVFAFPLHMPLTAFVAALVAGRLCGTQYHDQHQTATGGNCRA